MKTYKQALSILVFLFVTLIAACDGTEEPTKEEKFLKQISFNWALQSASVGGKDVTTSFSGLTLNVNADKSYTVTNAVSPIWPASGSFTLQAIPNSDLFDVVREDGAVLSVIECDETTLKLAFPYTSSSGRIKSISGNYEFVFSK